ncbi:hypothetical protein KN815_00140 (plasmid) [Streptomyces sp. 4503]|uniref:Ppx/GppA phosphatase N-terminal domain-containing protein n=1 Tax=Streptomyces niphimycinicus TaxID=2842201 RepID=A0ABS6C6Q5_9ACTN|nr:hypothetical protein [Streptomyces niphimycinicus]MBU3862580.1 hypothetical protein [Streptomyces niphimycinicus]
MRCGVIDIGSRTVHLMIADLGPDRPPEPVASWKQPVRVAEATDRQGVIRPDTIRSLVRAVTASAAAALAHHVDRLIPFVTSAVRDATNRDAVLGEIEAATGIRVGFMTGEEEARLTFRAARGWLGWSAGRILLLDIGGGSLEIACGSGRYPDFAVSLPLGADRLTRHHLPDATPVKKRDVSALRRHVRSVLGQCTAELRAQPAPLSCVATSRTFTQLARLAGKPHPRNGLPALHSLSRKDLGPWVPQLAAKTDEQRARLRGISASRAHQSLAGAIVAEAAMEVMAVERLTTCPWGLREGVLLDYVSDLEVESPAPPVLTSLPALADHRRLHGIGAVPADA